MKGRSTLDSVIFFTSTSLFLGKRVLERSFGAPLDHSSNKVLAEIRTKGRRVYIRLFSLNRTEPDNYSLNFFRGIRHKNNRLELRLDGKVHEQLRLPSNFKNYYVPRCKDGILTFYASLPRQYSTKPTP